MLAADSLWELRRIRELIQRLANGSAKGGAPKASRLKGGLVNCFCRVCDLNEVDLPGMKALPSRNRGVSVLLPLHASWVPGF